MIRYRYDGTTEGLISAIDHILRHEPDPQTVELEAQEHTMFDQGLFIATNSERTEVFLRRFSSAFPESARQVMYVILSEKEGMETSLLHYIHMVSVYGSRIEGHRTHPAVHDVHVLARKVSREIHRMKGLLRFAMLEDGSYLAKMEPDFNIIQPLSRFFTQRLRTQQWFIYDVKRSLSHTGKAANLILVLWNPLALRNSLMKRRMSGNSGKPFFVTSPFPKGRIRDFSAPSCR